MGRRLRRTVVVAGRVYPAGDVPPADVAARITNPDAWEPLTAEEAVELAGALGELESAGEAGAAALDVLRTAAEGARQENAELAEVSDAVTAAADVAADAPMAPPRSGRGSGAPVWRAYAEQRGIHVPAHAGRDDIIAALEQAGVPTE